MPEIPENVLTFLRDHIHSVEQLEMLLLLKRQCDREWSVTEISRTIASDPLITASRLARFHSLHILTSKEENVYRYAPESPALDRTIADLADAYSKYHVHVIGLIYSKPIDKVRTFADAFRLRKDKQ